MKLEIVTDEGENILLISAFEEFDLSKKTACDGVIMQMQVAMNLYRRRLEKEADEQTAS